MHRRLLLTLVSIFLHYHTYSQSFTKDITHARRGSFYTYIFKLTDAEARNIYRKDIDVVTNAYFHTLIDSFPTGKYSDKPVKVGHYLLANALGDRLEYELKSVNNLEVRVLNNKVDLAVWVADSLGRTIDQAQIQLKSRQIPFDHITQTYRLRLTNRRGLLAVTYQGHTTYQIVVAQYKNSRVKRISLRVLSALQVGYLLKPFRDIRSSLQYHQPSGWIKSLIAIFNPDYREHQSSVSHTKGYLVFNGSYTLNPAKAELMYYPVFFGRNEMKRVKVK
jgi:hypothetical protein